MADVDGIEDLAAVRRRVELDPLYATAAVIFIAVGGWYLLKELAPLLRPLVLAIFLAYTIMPAHRALRRRFHGRFAGLFLALLVSLAVLAVSLLLYKNLVDLRAELPRLIERAKTLIDDARAWGREHLPAWIFPPETSSTQAEADTSARLRALASSLVNGASAFLAEALVVGFYLIFLLLEARRLPGRVREGFPAAQADRVLGVVASINEAISSYLRAKTTASIVGAVPVFVILWAFGASFPGMWGVLAFIGNFIPYVGGLVALALPALLAFLELQPAWRPLAVLGLLLVSQFVTNNVIEPRLTARAVDLSPLVVLIALAFWGLCWGVVGMVLAVPLTVVLKIAWENMPGTRPLARLMSEE
ncbi:AI-2 transport protein TqsA [Aquisphaera giovannonii]|uniref:AI-2 transport protein TqsA n=1 Tax=Aquisphaera giovannonii TaxID=406548 RepID=A0A5B9VZR5_9BACT|nr:AI-2E family transporter [Aquisphaera giovannonii]QEH33275.1 AI-2 transport protein TqsA [Aquisphaera giovannonii]